MSFKCRVHTEKNNSVDDRGWNAIESNIRNETTASSTTRAIIHTSPFIISFPNRLINKANAKVQRPETLFHQNLLLANNG